jgi:hypothetical protein
MSHKDSSLDPRVSHTFPNDQLQIKYYKSEVHSLHNKLIYATSLIQKHNKLPCHTINKLVNKGIQTGDLLFLRNKLFLQLPFITNQSNQLLATNNKNQRSFYLKINFITNKFHLPTYTGDYPTRFVDQWKLFCNFGNKTYVYLLHERCIIWRSFWHCEYNIFVDINCFSKILR